MVDARQHNTVGLGVEAEAHRKASTAVLLGVCCPAQEQLCLHLPERMYHIALPVCPFYLSGRRTWELTKAWNCDTRKEILEQHPEWEVHGKVRWSKRDRSLLSGEPQELLQVSWTHLKRSTYMGRKKGLPTRITIAVDADKGPRVGIGAMLSE